MHVNLLPTHYTPRPMVAILLIVLLVFFSVFAIPLQTHAAPVIVIVAAVVVADLVTCAVNVIWGCGGGSGGGSGSGGGDSGDSTPPVDPSFSASPSTISRGEQATLTWEGFDSTSCAGQNFSTGNQTSGSVDVTPEQTTQYTVTCSNDGESAVTITVLQPELSITADPELVRRSETTTISWSAENVQACSVAEDNPDITDTWSGTSGSETTSQLTAQTTYTLTCQTGDFTTAQSVTVNLLPSYEEI